MSNQSIMNKNQINSILDLIQKSKKKFFLNYTSKKIVYFCKGIFRINYLQETKKLNV
jgi:hypothetical protein